MEQLGLLFSKPGRGGSRQGAGRKRLPAGLSSTPHRARPKHQAAYPVHVTLRAFVYSLRKQVVARAVLRALRDSHKKAFRIAHYSVQDNHVHLIVEAENQFALSSGLRGLAIRVARRVNQLLLRRGRFWADRWHGHVLKSPREVRNALVYVLKNRHKHAHKHANASTMRVISDRPASVPSAPGKIDELSSARWFNGFANPIRIPTACRRGEPPCVARANTWLLRIGWRRYGLICESEVPKAERRANAVPKAARARLAAAPVRARHGGGRPKPE